MVEHVRRRVVLRDRRAPAVVDAERNGVAHLERSRRHLADVEHVRAKLFDVIDSERRAAAGRDGACVGDLPARLRVEGSRLDDNADDASLRRRLVEERLLGVDDGTQLRRQRRSGCGRRVPLPLRRVVRRRDAHLGLQCVDLVGGHVDLHIGREVARLLRLRHRRLHRGRVAVLVDGEPLLLAHEQRQVEWESECVVHAEGVLAGEHGSLGEFLAPLVELEGALLQRLHEDLLLLIEDLLDRRRILLELWERFAKDLHECVDELMEEANGRVELLGAVAYRTAQDAAQHVPAPLVRRHRAVGDRERQRADVVSDHAIRHEDIAGVLVIILVLVWRRGGSECVDGVKEPGEDVDLVVRRLAEEDGRDALEPHASVHAGRRQRRQGAVLFAVELHEDVVPDLEHVGVGDADRVAFDHRALGWDRLAVAADTAVVDQVRRVAPANTVIVDLRAGAAWPGVAHLPEVVLHIAREDALRWHVLGPDIACLRVGRHAERLVALKVRDVQPVGGDLVHFREQGPRPLDGVLLEVVAKAPVSEHLEEGVVIVVLADVVEVVVLATRANALL
mmetsp:Transcript_24074/g.61499  ORF Transcript_24074/g.61499 Transcript_24074/m.61499 type:complete len:563 (-) Transcript_24074:625-2313(-)